MKRTGCLLAVVGAGVAGQGVWGSDGQPPRPLVVRAAPDVAPQVRFLAAAYAEQTGRTIDVRSQDAGTLTAACVGGSAPLVVLARDLNERERDAGLESRTCAFDALAFVVHPENPAQSLTREELRRVCGGRVRVWTHGEEMVLFNRRPGSAARDLVQQSLLGSAPFSEEALIKSDAALTASLLQTPGALGYTMLSSAGSEVKVLALEGVAPTEENVRSGAYPLGWPLVFATGGEPAGESGRFIDFVLSPDGQRAAAGANLVTVLPPLAGATAGVSPDTADGR